MDILQVNTTDGEGGAAGIARALHEGFRRRGHASRLAVGHRSSGEPDVFRIDHNKSRNSWARGCHEAAALSAPLRSRYGSLGRVYNRLKAPLVNPLRYYRSQIGQEDFDYPGTLPSLCDMDPQPDLLHLHNLHGGYFDLRALPALCRRLPVFMTLHDAWLLSGHCAHSFECERWKLGCGLCPDLTIHPAIRRDATAFNWQRKAQIYKLSRLNVATPSQWLMDRVTQSMLTPAIQDGRVIHNGVDLSLFRPVDKRSARNQIGIASNEPFVIVYAARGGRGNPFKDFMTFRRAAEICAEATNTRPILVIALGEQASAETLGTVEIRYIPYQQDRHAVAAYLQAADLYVHAARADTFPSAVLEALACGTPVIGTRVGGIPEQIDDGKTGLLVPPADAEAMAKAILALSGDQTFCRTLGRQAAEAAAARFGLDRMIDQYLNWYGDLVPLWSSAPLSAELPDASLDS